MKSKPELLAPAGDLEKLRTAIVYGADAVYLRGDAFSLWTGAGNFGEAELVEGLYYAHSAGVRIYVAVDFYASNADLGTLEEYIHWLDALGIDAVIVSAPDIFSLAQKIAPRLDIHFNAAREAGAAFWQPQAGADRVILPRGLALGEIAAIHRQSRLNLGVLIHGSPVLDWEDDTQGACFPNPRELSLLPRLGQLAQAGISSFMIAGRMRSVHYLATVLNAYRVNLDAWWQQGDEHRISEAWLQELARGGHRSATFVAVVKGSEPGWLYLEQRGLFGRGETLEAVVPGQLPYQFTVNKLYDPDGNLLEQALDHRQELKIPWPGQPLPQFTVLRRVDKE